MLEGALVATAITSTILVVFSKAAKREESTFYGVYEIRVHKVFLYLSYILVSAGAGLFWTCFYGIPFENQVTRDVLFSLGLVFVVLGFYFFLLIRNYLVTFNTEYLEVRNYRNKTVKLKWDYVVSARLDPLFSNLIIRSDNKVVKVKIHKRTKGIKTFVNMLIQKTSITLKDTNILIKLD